MVLSNCDFTFPLGRIPLRHLVYRVHSLPASMRPLVWDFGQLKPEVEQLYTCQIVQRFVSNIYVVNTRFLGGCRHVLLTLHMLYLR